MAAEPEKWISIMIVPEDGAGMRKWRITSKRYHLYKAAFWFISLFLLVGFVSMISVGVLYGRLVYYKNYNHDLLQAADKLDDIMVRLSSYESRESKLRSLLGGDLELPEPVASVPDGNGSELADGSGESGLNELERAISTEEARLRRLPTMWPVEPWQISKKFANTGSPRTDHLGIDILAPSKTGVIASGDGRVMFADADPHFGNTVIIDHENGWQTRYGHLESILVKGGAFVTKGHMIAVYGGSGGKTTGPHLHYGMYYKGQPVDPLAWLEKKPLLAVAQNNN